MKKYLQTCLVIMIAIGISGLIIYLSFFILSNKVTFEYGSGTFKGDITYQKFIEKTRFHEINLESFFDVQTIENVGFAYYKYIAGSYTNNDNKIKVYKNPNSSFCSLERAYWGERFVSLNGVEIQIDDDNPEIISVGRIMSIFELARISPSKSYFNEIFLNSYSGTLIGKW